MGCGAAKGRDWRSLKTGLPAAASASTPSPTPIAQQLVFHLGWRTCPHRRLVLVAARAISNTIRQLEVCWQSVRGWARAKRWSVGGLGVPCQ
eukprot:scaffold153830_cov35-Tisochrysis_lutea.AAC.3